MINVVGNAQNTDTVNLLEKLDAIIAMRTTLSNSSTDDTYTDLLKKCRELIKKQDSTIRELTVQFTNLVLK